MKSIFNEKKLNNNLMDLFANVFPMVTFKNFLHTIIMQWFKEFQAKLLNKAYSSLLEKE